MQLNNPVIFRPRRDSSLNWVTVNPVLREGELAYEYDTQTFRIGDGCSNWTELIPFKMPTNWCGYSASGSRMFKFEIPDKN